MTARTAEDVERAAATALQEAGQIANRLAADPTDRYDQVAALAAASAVANASGLLPLPDTAPVEPVRLDHQSVTALAGQLEQAAADLDELARSDRDRQTVYDRYLAATLLRDAAAALCRALPQEDV